MMTSSHRLLPFTLRVPAGICPCRDSLPCPDTGKGHPITVLSLEEQDYISLTDMATAKEGDNRSADIIKNWLRNRNTIEYLGIWEQLYNPNFKPTEFEGFRRQAGLNAFTLSPKKWTDATNAIGIIAKSGRYGGTYAHKDIALKFASWISVEFELYIVKELLTTAENQRYIQFKKQARYKLR